MTSPLTAAQTSAIDQRTATNAKPLSMLATHIARAASDQAAHPLSTAVTTLLRGAPADSPPPNPTAPTPTPPVSSGPNDPTTHFASPNPAVIGALQAALNDQATNEASVDPNTSFPDPDKTIDCTKAFRQGSAVILPEIDATTAKLKSTTLSAQDRTQLTEQLNRLNAQFAKLQAGYFRCLTKVHKVS
jgi:hypothetical protein